MSTTPLESFEHQGRQFMSFLSKHQFMHSFIDGNQSESLAKEGEILELQQENAEKHKQFLNVAAQLREEMEKLEHVKARHSAVKDRVDEILQEEENMPPGRKSNSKRLVMEEIIETERVLTILTNEQEGAQKKIEARKLRNAEISKEIAIQEARVGMKPTRKVLGDATDSAAGSSASIVDESLSALEGEKARLAALSEALAKFSGVAITSVDRGLDGVTVVAFTVDGTCEAVVCLDDTMRVKTLDVHSTAVPIDTAKLLCEACVLPSPQDLRQICFSLAAAQQSSKRIEEDLTVLRRKLLVTRLTPYSIQVTFPIGVAARVSLNEAYGEVPNGARLLALDGFGGWSPQELEDLRRDCNSQCFKQLNDIISWLEKELA